MGYRKEAERKETTKRQASVQELFRANDNRSNTSGGVRRDYEIFLSFWLSLAFVDLGFSVGDAADVAI
jgi:hypothetical protein